jgi:hypothetical protein
LVEDEKSSARAEARHVRASAKAKPVAFMQPVCLMNRQDVPPGKMCAFNWPFSFEACRKGRAQYYKLPVFAA